MSMWQFPCDMTKQRHTDLLLTNARVITMQSGRSHAQWVAVGEGRILALGDGSDSRGFVGPTTKEVDCAGMTLIPGFVDSHCHLLALASSLRGVDCRPEKASSIAELVTRIRERAEATPIGEWVRGFGYDEFYLAEGRHPTTRDLDSATTRHPLRLDHRTGHASVLNTRGLEEMGVSRETPDPPDGIIERDETGELTGVLFEMAEYMRSATRRPSPSTAGHADFLDGIKRANVALLSKGVTSLHDASPGNDLDRWNSFKDLKDGGYLTPRVVMMAGASHWQAFQEREMLTGSGNEGLRLGAVKVMLSLATGSIMPGREELEELAYGPHCAGFQLAFHAVEHEAVAAAAETILSLQARWPRPDARHRIEHCSECPPGVLRTVKDSGALVVTQPSFTYHNGDKYLALVGDELTPHLYPLAALLASEVPLAAGSDAPVTAPDPPLSIYSAVARTTVRGAPFDTGPSHAISPTAALTMHTLGGSFAVFDEGRTGSIAPGKHADLVLLDGDPTSVEVDALRQIRVVMTIVGGTVVWER